MKTLVSWFVIFSAVLLGTGGTATAQEATPASASSLLAGMGYPELRIQVHDDRFEVQEQITAGRTLIAYENVGQESRHSLLLRVPDDVDIEQALADAGPEAEEPPAWFFEAAFPGFVGETLPGQTSHAVVDLTPGTYVVVDNFIAVLEVVGTDATPMAVQAPATDGMVSLFEMGFTFPDTLSTGPQVWEVTNTGTVPHELLLLRSTVPVTGEQLVELFLSEDETATPVGGGPSMANIEPVGGLGWLSSGATAWTEVNLEPGTYGAVCFVFDPATGMPHLMQGMVAVFTVGDEATPIG